MTVQLVQLFRGLGIAIAIAGVIDPPVTSMRRTQPTVALVSSDAADSSLVDRVERELAPAYTIVRGPFEGAAAVVSVGDRLPGAIDTIPASMPAFAVTSATGAPGVRLSGVRAPARVMLDSRASMEARLQVEGRRGRTVDVTLSHGGVVIDRVTRQIATGEETMTAALTFAPTAEGAAALTLSAGTGDDRPRATADVLVDIRRTRWAVLAFDRRPSWMSTFVRRALESDPRFVVTSRVITSRDLSTDTGRPPGSLDDLPSLALFDAVVIGAPEELTDRDVSGLEAFLRRRGGAVCLLLDRRAAGPYDRLIGPMAWSAAATSAPAPIAGAGDDDRKDRPERILATELAWPSTLPPGAHALFSSEPPSNATATTTNAPARPIVWSTAIGGGRVIVSGALDAWRLRDTAAASFDRFWRTVIADAAAGAPPVVEIDVERPLLAPGASTEVTVTLRDETLADSEAGRPLRASVRIALDTPAGPVPVRAWPDGPPGRFRATVRAPETPGLYRLSITGNGTQVDTPVVVQSDVTRPSPDERALITAWTASRGGITVPAERSREIGQALDRKLSIETQRTTWHPMRSAWWIVPFALALGTEWWSRRRHGQA